MELEELYEKYIYITFHDGTTLEGLLVEVKSVEDYEDMIFYKTLTIRDEDAKYNVVYLNEIESIEEIK